MAHVLLIADILISNSFNHYVNLDIMLSLGIPCVVAICAVHYCMQRLYAQHYKTEKELGRRGVCHAAVWAESCGGKSLCGGTAVEAMDTGVCPVTISIGVTRYNGRDNYQLAVQCADKALYQAKK